ncbi:MAG: hypothetical protein ACREI3_07975 [Nitrospirales bacterium]
MNSSTTIADSLLRQAWPRFLYGQAGGLAAQSLDVLFKSASVPSSTRP